MLVQQVLAGTVLNWFLLVCSLFQVQAASPAGASWDCTQLVPTRLLSVPGAGC